jgi:iron complex transport system substrate-binding protein
MNYISIRPYVNYLINCLSSKVLYFIILIPVLLAGMRMFVFNLLDNVAGELEQYPEVSPEWILEQNPEAIILIDRTDGYLGYEVEGDTAVKDYYESIKNNKVLSKTDALKNEQFYVISSELLGADKTYLGALYLVKWFYPEQFTNMDPEKSLREYFDEWLDVPYQGEWAYPSASE